MEMKEEQQVKEIAANAVEEHEDLFLVDVKIKGSPGNQKVLVFIDGDNGVSVDKLSLIHI